MNTNTLSIPIVIPKYILSIYHTYVSGIRQCILTDLSNTEETSETF